MTTATMTRFEPLCSDKCPNFHVSNMGTADPDDALLGRHRIPSLSDVFGKIAEALGAQSFDANLAPIAWPESRHRAGTA